MMFLFGGVPDICYERFTARAVRELPFDQFTGVRLHASAGKSYMLTAAYCRELVDTLARYVEGRSDCLEDGVGVVLLTRPWETQSFENEFWPFAICIETRIDEPLNARGEAARRAANAYASAALNAANQMRKPVGALAGELRARLRRTPLLLPIRHFNSIYLRDLIQETRAAVRTASDPGQVIRQVCSRFEEHHPFAKVGRRQGAFSNDAGVRFTAPGRQEFHARRTAKREGQHNDHCFLNARTRLGGPFQDGFHYDCTGGRTNYSGRFKNCHNAEDDYRGRPHLNVYPNDFIR
jgi:hypothetical protein